MKKTKAQKAATARIEKAYYANCNGVQIGVMDIGKVFKVGEQAIAEGADDTVLAEKIVAFVNTIRHN